MRKRGKLVTSEAMDPDLAGTWLQIGGGENMEMTQVLKVRGRKVTVGRWRWYHSLLRFLRRLPRRTWLLMRRAVFWVREALCSLRGHRLTRVDRWGDHTCWCEERAVDPDDIPFGEEP